LLSVHEVPRENWLAFAAETRIAARA
jgi:hypothetical protein